MSDTNVQAIDEIERLRAERDALQAKVDAIDALCNPCTLKLTNANQVANIADRALAGLIDSILHPKGDTPT